MLCAQTHISLCFITRNANSLEGIIQLKDTQNKKVEIN
jgi:hypothetical protein